MPAIDSTLGELGIGLSVVGAAKVGLLRFFLSSA
jgi:hypothetical protein